MQYIYMQYMCMQYICMQYMYMQYMCMQYMCIQYMCRHGSRVQPEYSLSRRTHVYTRIYLMHTF